MNAHNDNTAPPRTGVRRLIPPWEYRHLRAFGVARTAGGSFLAFGGVLLLSVGAYGWAALFLVLGTLNLAGGIWYTTIAGSGSART